MRRQECLPRQVIDLTGAILDNAVFTDLDFTLINFTNASFSNSLWKNINIHGGILNKANFYRAGIFDSDFSFVETKGIDLTEAVFIRTKIPHSFAFGGVNRLNAIFEGCPIIDLKKAQ